MLKEDMSKEDWEKLQTDSGIKWGENGIINYSKFMEYTYQEQ
jgi:hypothetical protein